jgi:tripartite-type tricarboxylate transporter receptor subunit TctC
VTSAFPAKPIRYVVPFGNGPTAAQARLLASDLENALGQPVLVENHPGESGMTGTALVARAAPDGYMLLAANPGPLTVGPNVRAAPYDPSRDFAPVVLIATLPSVIAARTDFAPKNLAELVAFARAHPYSVRCASPGIGTVGHLAAELLQHVADVRFTHVPSPGLPEAIVELAERRVDVLVIPVSDARPLAQVGRIRGLAATTRTRIAAWPELPTAAESGVARFESFNWNGIAAPVGTPPDIVARINAALNEVLRTGDARAALVEAGYELAGGSPEAFGAFVAAESAKWRDVARRAGLARKKSREGTAAFAGTLRL